MRPTCYCGCAIHNDAREPAGRSGFAVSSVNLIPAAGGLSRSQCKGRLLFFAASETVQRILNVWENFPLPTQASSFKQPAILALASTPPSSPPPPHLLMD